MGLGVAAHAVHSASGAGSNRVCIAARMFSRDGNRTIGATDNGPLMIERIGAAEIDDKAGVLGTAHEGHVGTNFNAKRFIGFGVGN